LVGRKAFNSVRSSIVKRARQARKNISTDLSARFVRVRLTGAAELFFGVAAIAFVSACGGSGSDCGIVTECVKNPALSAITVSPLNQTLAQGQTLQMQYSATAGGAGVSTSFAFSSTASSVASVSGAGLVTALSSGTAGIVVSATGAGGGFETVTRNVTVTIVVSQPPEALRGLSVSGAALAVGQTATLSPVADKANASVQLNYQFSSQSPSVVAVSAAGVVTALAQGISTITVTATGSAPGLTTSQRTAQATITVTAGTGPGLGFGAEQFAAIPAGTYQRGSLNGGSDETPVRTISISAFQMQRTEVSQSQWRQVMAGTGIVNPSYFSGCDQCPVEGVSWEDVQQFLSRMNIQNPGRGYRLPTEAEWEYAARAGTTGDVNVSGSAIEDLGWLATNSGNTTHVAAQKIANAWTLSDMLGNVWEWVSDWYDLTYYATGPSQDPLGVAGSAFGTRVVRGGSFANTAASNRPSTRFAITPTGRYSNVGFRMVRNP
jgi:formylglycine-generating enzyme required for sulfatase activity